VTWSIQRETTSAKWPPRVAALPEHDLIKRSLKNNAKSKHFPMRQKKNLRSQLHQCNPSVSGTGYSMLFQTSGLTPQSVVLPRVGCVTDNETSNMFPRPQVSMSHCWESPNLLPRRAPTAIGSASNSLQPPPSQTSLSSPSTPNPPIFSMTRTLILERVPSRGP
jgi:hypothetical protein